MGEQFEDAYFLLSGEVQIVQNDKSYRLGAGSVIGLSEGMVGLASKFSAVRQAWPLQALVRPTLLGQ